MQPQPPPHPMDQLTTYELRTYRHELEHALKTLPDHVAVRELLQAKLAGVLAEQESRSKAAKASRFMT